MRDQRAPFVAEFGEEPPQRLLVAPFGCPHQPAAVVIHDHDEVLVAAPEGDLIDTNPPQPRQHVLPCAETVTHPGGYPAHRSPRDSHQLGDRSLVALHREPADLIIEGSGGSGIVVCPRHLHHADAMLRTSHPRRCRFDEATRRPQIQCSPAPRPLAQVIQARLAAADPAALAPATPQTHPDHQVITGECHLLDDRTVDPQQLCPYTWIPHAVPSANQAV